MSGRRVSRRERVPPEPDDTDGGPVRTDGGTGWENADRDTEPTTVDLEEVLGRFGLDLGRGLLFNAGQAVRAAGATASVLLAVLVGIFLAGGEPIGAVGIALLILAAAAVASGVEIVQPYEKRALTVFGEYRGLLEPGIHFVPPFVSGIHAFDTRTRTVDVPAQEAITEDNSPVIADAVVFLRVTDAERAFLEVDDHEQALAYLAQTSLRAALGDMQLDETLRRRDRINDYIGDQLAGPTAEWGVRIESVEVSKVRPSDTVLDAMERQTSAERERRAMILEAQGERRSAIERAEGQRRASVVTAQGQKQASILQAQGDAIATVLRARAARAMGERAILRRGFDTLGAIGRGPSTTYVLPQELTSLVGRYGRHLTGSAVPSDTGRLEGREFDAETRELLGLDDVDAILENGSDGVTELPSAENHDRAAPPETED